MEMVCSKEDCGPLVRASLAYCNIRAARCARNDDTAFVEVSSIRIQSSVGRIVQVESKVDVRGRGRRTVIAGFTSLVQAETARKCRSTNADS